MGYIEKFEYFVGVNCKFFNIGGKIEKDVKY
jgi:hypothetical protein